MTSATSAPRGRAAADLGPPGPARRGLSLVELLVAIAIVVAIAALALPLAGEAVERRRFESASDELVGQLLLARAQARIDAAMLEVTLRRDGTGAATIVEVRPIDLEALARGELDPSEPAPPLAESWAARRYDAIVEEEPAGPEGESEAEERDDDLALPRRVALFVPDGSAPLAPRLLLRDEAGRRAIVVVNPYSGRAALESLSGPARRPDAEVEEETDEDETDEETGRPAPTEDRTAGAAPPPPPSRPSPPAAGGRP